MTGPVGVPRDKSARLDRLAAEHDARADRAGTEKPAPARTDSVRPSTRLTPSKAAGGLSAPGGAESAQRPDNAHARESAPGSASPEIGQTARGARELVADYRATAGQRVRAGGPWAGRADLAAAVLDLRRSLGALGCSKHLTRRTAGADLAAEAVTVLRELAERGRGIRSGLGDRSVRRGRRLLDEHGRGDA